MELIYDYMRDDRLRHQLNALTQKTFGFHFEDWFAGGYFEGDYIPFSFYEDGKIISNVSVNRMRFMQNGKIRNYIQLGTVMTDESYRRQGLARRLTEHVCSEYEGKCDGIYLFADLGALDFYRKTGFTQGLQYQYTLKKDRHAGVKKGSPFQKADPKDVRIRAKYPDAVRHSAVNAALEQLNKYGLQMFYTADLSNVYYSADMDCFAVLEKEGDTLLLRSVISQKRVSLQDVIARIAVDYRCLKVGFTPCAEDISLFEASVFDGEDDYRLFYKGRELESIEKDHLFFPQLSHA